MNGKSRFGSVYIPSLSGWCRITRRVPVVLSSFNGVYSDTLEVAVNTCEFYHVIVILEVLPHNCDTTQLYHINHCKKNVFIIGWVHGKIETGRNPPHISLQKTNRFAVKIFPETNPVILWALGGSEGLCCQNRPVTATGEFLCQFHAAGDAGHE